VSHDDVLFGYRLRLFTLAEEIGVRPACRQMGGHHSTYYRWKRNVDRCGLEALRVRERRRPRMPNQIGPHLEQRVIAFALANPGFGARRISSQLRGEKWGGIRLSEHGVYRVLRRVGLNTRSKRLVLVARRRDPYERKPERPPAELHIDAREPGEKVQLDCFVIGRLTGTRGSDWQYTAADVASQGAPDRRARAPSGPRTQRRGLAPTGGHHRQRLGVPLPPVSEPRSRPSAPASASSRPGRPNSNGCVERAQLTILESAGARRSPARWHPSRPPSSANSTSTSTTSTTTAPTTDASPRTSPRRYRPRRPQDKNREMSQNRRHISGVGRPNRSAPAPRRAGCRTAPRAAAARAARDRVPGGRGTRGRRRRAMSTARRPARRWIRACG
jgi:transposase